MKFGVFDHVDRGSSSLADLYESRLKLAEIYDGLQFRERPRLVEDGG